VLELTALPSMGEEHWVPLVRETDALLVQGGDALYLSHWMRQSGLAGLLPSLRAVWAGFSGGSMVMAPNIGEEAVSWVPPAGGDEALGIVDFSIFPHLDHENMPENSMADAERWAAKLPCPGYAIDDQTAIKVTDGTVEVISEGHWKLFTTLSADNPLDGQRKGEQGLADPQRRRQTLAPRRRGGDVLARRLGLDRGRPSSPAADGGISAAAAEAKPHADDPDQSCRSLTHRQASRDS